jgi:anti-anti-sigma regulatory factor
VSIRNKGDYCILCPGGELSMSDDGERLIEDLRVLFNSGRRSICIDLSQSPVINSSVIGAIVSFHAEIGKKDGDLVILNARNVALEALMCTNVHRIIRFVRSEDEL